MGRNKNIKPVPYYQELLNLLAQAYAVVVVYDPYLAEEIKQVVDECDPQLLFSA